MTCKDCIHYELCDVQAFNGLNKNFEPEKDWKHCGVFKDKSKYIELPCNIGDAVYHIIREIEIAEESIYAVRIYEDKHIAFSASRKGGRIVFRKDEIGKTVFLTKSEAEQKLKELLGDN